MMRKYIYILLCIITFSKLIAQDEINFGDFQKPVPSESYLPTYVDRPVSISTGVPNINIPLFGLTTNNGNVNIQTSLNYNIENIKIDDVAGEVGLGWTFSGKGVISREINGTVDEMYDDSTTTNYIVNEFDDIYYYNLPNGISGKFKFVRNLSNNTFSVLNLSPNKVKIEYTRTSNTSTLILDSFTITDDYGVKYVFSDYSISLRTYPFRKLYNSAFYISQITDPGNVTLVTYYYQKKDRYDKFNQLAYKTCKLSSISSANKGSVEINYVYDSTQENTFNDADYITSVSYYDQYARLLFKYIFNFSSKDFNYYDTNYSKRILNDIKKQNSSSQNFEQTVFIYEQGSGLLNKIKSPTGGVVEYTFESNDYYFNKESTTYLDSINGEYIDPDIQYFEDGNIISYDTKNTKFYTLNVTGTPNVLKKFYLQHFVTDYYPLEFTPDTGCSCQDSSGNTYIDPTCSCYGPNSLFVDYKITKNGQVYDGSVLEADYTKKLFALYPGTYTIEIFGTGGTGDITPSEVKFKTPPYKNSALSNGYRIKNSKSYNSITDYIPSSTQNYYYTDFNNSMNSSGYKFNYEANDGTYATSQYVLYNNVKVSDGVNGYTNFYYKTPNDYATSTVTINNLSQYYRPYYSLTKSGVLYKKEIYNSINQLISSSDYNTVFDEIPNADYYRIYDSSYYSKNSYVKSNSTVEKFYNAGSQNFIQTSSESNYNLSNFGLSSSKLISSDGIISEVFYKYAGDKNIQNLITANMISIPLEVESKINNKTVSKTETKYENATNLFPSSVVSTNPNDSSTKTTVLYDIYDAKGNLVQYTTDYDAATGKGNPVTIIWGYNKTLPIAKIEGAKLSDIGTLADDIVTKSNADIDAATENTLLTALDTFRNQTTLKNFFITTYTYDPLIGVTTITPPNGMKEIYKYDVNNRLKSVIDVNGNIIKEMKYNNKQ